MCNEIEYAMLEEYIAKLEQKEKESEKPMSVQVAA